MFFSATASTQNNETESIFARNLSVSRKGPIARPPLRSLTLGSSRAVSVWSPCQLPFWRKRDAKSRDHPSSHHLFALIAGHIWSEPDLALLSSASRGIAWKRSLYLDPFPLPTSTKVSQWRSFRSFSVLERRIDRPSAPEAAEANTREKRRMERERVYSGGWGLCRGACLRRGLGTHRGKRRSWPCVHVQPIEKVKQGGRRIRS